MLATVALSILVSQTQATIDDDYFLTVAGSKLHFRVRGTNRSHPYLVILHGGPGFSAHQFYNWGKALEGSVNVVYMDQRGSGQSDRLPFKNPFQPTPQEASFYTIDRLVKDLDAVKRELRIRRWYVLGHSWGGMLGLEYSIKRRREVMGFIDMDGMLSAPETQAWIVNCARIVRDRMGEKDLRRVQCSFLINAYDIAKRQREKKNAAYSLASVLQPELYFANPVHRSPAFESISLGLAPYNLKASDTSMAPGPEAALDLTEKLLERDDTKLLSLLSVPTLAIWGRNDGVCPPSTLEKIKDRLARSTTVLLDDCGHFPFLEKAKETTDAVLSWLTQGPGR